jgi:hypothetical protein
LIAGWGFSSIGFHKKISSTNRYFKVNFPMSKHL